MKILIVMFASLSMISAEFGSFKSCDASSSFEMTWSPKIIATGSIYQGHLSYTAQEVELNDFEICHKMWLEGMEEPILQGCANVTCLQVVDEIKRFIPEAGCPFKFKNENRSFNFFLDYTVPTFEADLKTRVKFKDPKTRQVLLCIEGNISMKE